MIRPLGEQIIIRLITPDSIGSIIIPDSAKGITLTGTGNPHEAKEATDYLVNAGLFEELVSTLKEDSRAASPAKQQSWRQELAARLEKARSMPLPSNLGNAVHFVEAEVIAVGPGRRGRDETVFADMLYLLQQYFGSGHGGISPSRAEINALIARAEDQNARQPPMVKVGSRIWFHPAVQRFDREIEPSLIGLPEGNRCFIIREESILAVLEMEAAA